MIQQMAQPNQYLLLYVLDLLSVFARKSEKNLMTATSALLVRPYTRDTDCYRPRCNVPTRYHIAPQP